MWTPGCGIKGFYLFHFAPPSYVTVPPLRSTTLFTVIISFIPFGTCFKASTEAKETVWYQTLIEQISSCYNEAMGPVLRTFVYTVTLTTIFLMGVCDARRRKHSKQKQIQSRETNIFNFVRLLVLRLVYGIATSMGFGESISEFLGGIFVPPGVEDDDDELDLDY
ncbi:uncharacterized protein LOC117282301 isoform X2 [Cryptotermes secundus]|uniref:uncharacterized protein LOC117282301 isoform X2 n=1 Tax=Cryptotermes secundus TaxID=105785 RepID=UPI001454C5CF|nr:uncharacterized protein LOC117282301 isoform X2 [Cryptotermes secundus]